MTDRFITQEGLEKIRKELNERKTTLRKEIAVAIKEAKEQGDLSENAEYAAARQRQSENEARIIELEMMMKTVRVVDQKGDGSNVSFGSTLTVKREDTGTAMTFRIVGTNEADPASGKISNESPIGRAFEGKSEGELVSVDTPSGKVVYKIISVE
ncbi:MAG: transcription elongation factor GreA [Candidatus Moraniibacteriota bacterium]|nr:MAG: transcription elongation factor GreA [Candidatus Moranbacteria bacterium]